jgi:hypothetical protein
MLRSRRLRAWAMAPAPSTIRCTARGEVEPPPRPAWASGLAVAAISRARRTRTVPPWKLNCDRTRCRLSVFLSPPQQKGDLRTRLRVQSENRAGTELTSHRIKSKETKALHSRKVCFNIPMGLTHVRSATQWQMRLAQIVNDQRLNSPTAVTHSNFPK